MDAFTERLMLRAATIDELLSDAFAPLPGQKGDTDLAARRLAAWCRAGASGDWALFARRLARDGLSMPDVLQRLASVSRNPAVPPPAWLADALWIDAALQDGAGNGGIAGTGATTPPTAPRDATPFAPLYSALLEQAEARLWSGMDAAVSDTLTAAGRACLRAALAAALSGLATPALYECFGAMRMAAAAERMAEVPEAARTQLYDRFIADMRAGGWRRLFDDKPVLLRLLAVLTRQWIDTTREFLLRLHADLPLIRRDLLRGGGESRVAAVEGELSDPHNGGRAVKIVRFEDGARVVYKPKDLRLDAAWAVLVERLNAGGAPIDLAAMRVIARDGYGWSAFVAHAPCADRDGVRRFFRRAGAWLALLHCFAATDMHQENIIAAGEHPVPIDLETILQAAAEEHRSRDPAGAAFDAAMDKIANSILMVGLLPAYGRAVDTSVFAIGGLNADWNAKTVIGWTDLNTDAMRPVKTKETERPTPNLPRVGARYAAFADHLDDFVAGFAAYAEFLRVHRADAEAPDLFDGFAGLPVRKVIRPTRFYYMLLQRLKNHKSMDDGAVWSAQADFVARLSDWEHEADPVWPLQRAERAALLTLNVPHFVTASDGRTVRDDAGAAIETGVESGLVRARQRADALDAEAIAWQIEVIRESTNARTRAQAPPAAAAMPSAAPPGRVPAPRDIFRAGADRIADELAHYAVRRGSSAAWIGLDWLGDSEAFQLVCLGPDLYNGVCGIALFLAAHAAVSGRADARDLARAAVAYLRSTLKGRNAARMARSLGLGGATGLGSVVYAFTAMAALLADDSLRADAQGAAALFTDELIGADRQLDVIGGSAGGILGLLRLYRDSGDADVLRRAVKCGEHLLAQPRLGPQGRGCWARQGLGARPINGMSHGAAGFAYALAALAAASERDDFAAAAAQCIAFENASYDGARHNWPDLRAEGKAAWPCRWCHGAPGIGLARIGIGKRRGMAEGEFLAADIRNAVLGVEASGAHQLDTLCCGALGGIEFLCEAGDVLRRRDLRELAAQRLLGLLQRAAAAGDYRWNNGRRQFNLGLFRGLAGIGYTLLRRLDPALPNVLIWE